MARAGAVLPLLAALSAVLTAMFVADVISSKNHQSACEMTYSWPVYTPVTWPAAAHYKYSLHRVDQKQYHRELTGVPVLFIPGHLGSFKQARSISRHLWDADQEMFDVFAVHFDEEPSGLNGNFITEQAEYVNEVVRAILKQYKKQSKTARHQARSVPDSVVIVAHSMGGIVARTAELLPNYKRRSIQHVVGLGVPYVQPPFPFDSEMQAVYSKIQESRAASDSAGTVYVSITGGHKDTLVHSSTTPTDSSSLWGIAALTTAMPSVQTTVDHFCLLWCHQLLKSVAGSLHASVDSTSRELENDPKLRLDIAREWIFGHAISDAVDDDATLVVENENTVSTMLHREYVLAGYIPEEYVTYTAILPQDIFTLLRTHFTTIVGIMYALSLYILSVQVSRWQDRFGFQTNAVSPSDEEGVPAFSVLLHPSAHVPDVVKRAASCIDDAVFRGKCSSIGIVATSGIVAVAVGVLAQLRHQNIPGVSANATRLLNFAVLYLYSIGLMFIVAKLFSAVRDVVISRVIAMSGSVGITPWKSTVMVCIFVVLFGHVKTFSPFETVPWHSSRACALLVLAVFAVYFLRLIVLGGTSVAKRDQLHINGTLFTILFLSNYSWVGKIAYFARVAQLPPVVLENDILLEGVSYIVVLALESYVMALSVDWMLPLPPTAFFGDSTGLDSASLYDSGKKLDPAVKITAENCPKCIFEDAGPGAVLIEYSDRHTHSVTNRKTGEVVVVGPTFRVVSCDCVYRFDKSRDFCDFCVRSCRLCGGGDGNFQQAAKYREFLEGARTELAMHGLVPFVLRLLAVVQLTYGFYRPHLPWFFTPAVAILVVVYHFALRNPLEVRRKKQSKTTSSKKKKTKKTSTTTAGTSQSTASLSVNNGTETSSKSKKKKKKKTTSTTTASTSRSSADASAPLIQEVDPNSLD